MPFFAIQDKDALDKVASIREHIKQAVGSERADYVMLAALQVAFSCLFGMGLRSKGIRDTVSETFKHWELDELSSIKRRES